MLAIRISFFVSPFWCATGEIKDAGWPFVRRAGTREVGTTRARTADLDIQGWPGGRGGWNLEDGYVCAAKLERTRLAINLYSAILYMSH